MKLLHHWSPALSVLEVAAEADPQVATSPALLQQECLVSLTETWDVTTASRDDTLKTKMRQEAAVKVLDFAQELPPDMLEVYDLLIASDLGSCASDPLQQVERMSMVVKQGGSMCILAAHSVLMRIQPFLDGSHVETTVLRGPAEAPSQELSLVVIKKLLHSHTNGTNGTNGITNGAHGAATGPQQVTLIQAARPTEEAQAVTSHLIAALTDHGYETDIVSWGSDISGLAGKSCISLLEFQKTLLQDLAADDFERVKKLLVETKVFWVTALNNPGSAIIDGLVRVIRNETPGSSLRVFHADTPSLAPAERLADKITKAFLWAGEDDEFRVEGDLLHVSRVEEDKTLNKEIHDLLPGAAKTVSSVPLKDVPYPVKLCVRSPGMLSSVCLEPDDSAETELEPDYIEINVKATALK